MIDIITYRLRIGSFAAVAKLRPKKRKRTQKHIVTVKRDDEENDQNESTTEECWDENEWEPIKSKF